MLYLGNMGLLDNSYFYVALCILLGKLGIGHKERKGLDSESAMIVK